MEDNYQNSNDENILSALLKIKSEYNLMLGEQVGKYIRKFKQKFFELGDKPDRLLSRQIKDMLANRVIHKISSPSGQVLTDPKLINDTFFYYYSNLYTSIAFSSDTKDFLNRLNVPVLDESARVDLDFNFTFEENQMMLISFFS